MGPFVESVMEKSLLFTIRSHANLGRDVAAAGGFDLGEAEVQVFPDGELYHRVTTPVNGRDTALLAGTGSEADTLEAYDLAFALVEQGARSLSIGIPFFGYATMERVWMPGDAVKAKSRARLWSALPAAPMGNRVVLLEPHSPGLPHYFGTGLQALPIDGIPLMLRMLERFQQDIPVLCSPDTGRIKWVDELALRTGWPSAFVLKRRSSDGSVEALGLVGEVRGRMVVFCDDMIRTGRTLMKAAETCLEAGASALGVAAVHGAFTEGALEQLEASGLFSVICCTDSHPRAYGLPPNRIHVESCAPALAEALRPMA